LHVVFLDFHLFFDVLVDGGRAVPCIDQVLLHGTGVTHVLIPSHHNSALSINCISNVVTFFLVVPSLEVMSQSVSSTVHEHPS